MSKVTNGEYHADCLITEGSESNDFYSSEDDIMRRINESCYAQLNEYLNQMRQDGWVIVKIDQPSIEVQPPRWREDSYCYVAKTFLLWQRKPMAEAIYGD